MEDSDDDFSSFDNEFVEDLKIAGNNVVWDRPGTGIGIGLGWELEFSLMLSLVFLTRLC